LLGGMTVAVVFGLVGWLRGHWVNVLVVVVMCWRAEFVVIVVCWRVGAAVPVVAVICWMGILFVGAVMC
jgi:hypothetical protein